MNTGFKNLTLAFLLTSSFLTQTAHGMMLDDKESAKECYKKNPSFFWKGFGEAEKNVKENFFQATKDIDDKMSFDDIELAKTKECAVLKKEKEKEKRKGEKKPLFSMVQYYEGDEILNLLAQDRDIFLESYFSNSDMNNIRFTTSTCQDDKYSYYFCNSEIASKSVKRDNYNMNAYVSQKESEELGLKEGQGWYHDKGSFATQIGDDLYKFECNKAYNSGRNSKMLFNFLDSAVRGIGQKFSKLKRSVVEFCRDPNKKDWRAINYLKEQKLDVNHSMFEACRAAMKLTGCHSMGYIYDENLKEFIPLFKKSKEMSEEYPQRYHVETFQRLIWNKIPLSEENIDKVMQMTKSIDWEKGTMKEKLKRFSLSVNENYRTFPQRATEWLKNNNNKNPTTQEINLVKHMMSQDDLKLTNSLFEAAKYLMDDEKKIISSPTSLEIKATECLMNMENFKERKAPQKQQIDIAAAVLSLGIDQLTMPILKKAKQLLDEKKLTKENLLSNVDTF